MLAEIFYWILNLSIIGSVCGLILLALRKIKKLPRFAVYVLWLIPLIRFWNPLGFATRYSLLNLIRYSTKTVVVWPQFPDFTFTNVIRGAEEYFPVTYKTDLFENILRIASVIWIVVALAGILAAITLYFLTRVELKNAVHLKENIYQSDRIASPAVFGILKPRIIIPSAMTEGEMRYILLHEWVHIKRRDNLWRMVAIFTACIHWFNPLLWIFLKCFFEDAELACDSKVLKTLEESKAKEYARAVLAAAQGKAFFSSAFGGAKTRVRIENILSYKKLTLISAVFLALLVIAIASVLITNAAV